MNYSVIVGQVNEGAYEVVKRFEAIESSRDEMKRIHLESHGQRVFAETALEYRYDGKHTPVHAETLLRSNRLEDNADDFWTVYQRTQENIIRDGQSGRTAKGQRARTHAINGIDGDIKTNRFLWSLAEKMKELKS